MPLHTTTLDFKTKSVSYNIHLYSHVFRPHIEICSEDIESTLGFNSRSCDWTVNCPITFTPLKMEDYAVAKSLHSDHILIF